MGDGLQMGEFPEMTYIQQAMHSYNYFTFEFCSCIETNKPLSS